MGELDAPAGFTYKLTAERDGVVLIRMAGDLDMATAEGLDQAVEDVLPTVTERLIVDASQLRFADSSAIALWVKWRNTVPAIEIRNVPPLVRRVIEAMGLTEALHVS